MTKTNILKATACVVVLMTIMTANVFPAEASFSTKVAGVPASGLIFVSPVAEWVISTAKKATGYGINTCDWCNRKYSTWSEQIERNPKLKTFLGFLAKIDWASRYPYICY